MNNVVDEGRRKALMGLLSGSATLLLPASVSAATNFWDRPRSLDLYREATHERATGVYWKNGGLDAVGYPKMCHLLRDVRGGSAIQMNPRLLDLLCAMQAWVSHFGFGGPMTILSGYRSPKTNANTEGAARNSMHMYGQAADIQFPGLPMNYLGKLAQHYAAGGVGFYVSSNFVHVDTGRIRSWRK